MTGLILAAGNGTRLAANSTAPFSKALTRVCGKPLISYSLEELVRLQVPEALIVVGKNHSRVISALGEDYRGMRLSYVVQEKPRGLANAIFTAADRIAGDCILQLCDEILLDATPALCLPAAQPDADFILGYTHASPADVLKNYSLETDADDFLLHSTEKPAAATDDRKGTGVVWFSAACLAVLRERYDPKENRPDTLCDFMNLLTESGFRGKAVCVAAEEINVNTPEDLAYAEERLKRGAAR